MCNLYSHTSNGQAILDFTKAMAVAEIVGNLEPQTGIFPDYAAPIVRNFGGMRQLTKMSWGPPSSQGRFTWPRKSVRKSLRLNGRS